MPLDDTNWSHTETETKPDLSKPSLEGLSWLLRHMPEDHEWNFAEVGGPNPAGCGSAGCAFGLAFATWRDWDGSDHVWDAPGSVLESFFFPQRYVIPAELVTPTMVADRIDAYLAQRQAME